MSQSIKHHTTHSKKPSQVRRHTLLNKKIYILILTVLMLVWETESNPFTVAFITTTFQRFKLIYYKMIWFQQRNFKRLNIRVVCSWFMQRRCFKRWGQISTTFNSRVRFSQQTNSLYSFEADIAFIFVKVVCTLRVFLFWVSYCKQSNTTWL